jgi:hypothetical protein
MYIARLYVQEEWDTEIIMGNCEGMEKPGEAKVTRDVNRRGGSVTQANPAANGAPAATSRLASLPDPALVPAAWPSVAM